MKVKEYIESGILESFVLGELSPQEEKEVIAMVEKHPDVKDELARIEDTMEKVAMKTAITPPSELKAKIFDSIEGKSKSEDENAAKVVDFNRKQHASYWRYIAAASVSLAVISSVVAYNYWNKWKNTQEELTTLIAQNERVAEDYNTVNQQLEQIENQLKIINSQDFKRVKMTGTDNAPNSLAYIYWNDQSQEVYLNIQNLQQLSEAKQYQLWALIDGVPVDAGVFDHNDSGMLKMKNIASGAGAFAVTIEPKGGSVNPTLETMQVMGAVSES